MLPTGQIKKAIEDNKISDITKAMLNGDYYGMTTFDKSLARLHVAGQVSFDDALANATTAETVRLLIKGAAVDGFKL